MMTMVDGLFSFPLHLPFTPFGKACRARQRILSMIDAKIAEYRDDIAKLSAEELSSMRLNQSGVYSSGESVLQNLIVTGHLSGNPEPDSSLQDQAVGLLLAGYDTTAALETSTAYLVARGHDRSASPPPTP